MSETPDFSKLSVVESLPPGNLSAHLPKRDRKKAKTAAEAGPPDHSEDAIALRFSAEMSGTLLHVHEWGAWLAWDGARWKIEAPPAVFERARHVCRAVGRGELAQVAARIGSAGTVAAVERLARGDARHLRAADAFDADPWLLNTPSGVVDLRKGTMRPHRPEDMFTKVTAVAPGGGCPNFLAFLHQITKGDAAMTDYLQRWFGYCLTGTTREHSFLFGHGPGGNGKGVLFNTVASVWGDYAATADMSLFTVTRNEQHPAGLASLRGARLVLAQETEAGVALAEAKLKALTGGDRISARFMRGNPFEYQPTFKLVMVGNHRPVLKTPDAAMRRRLHLVPFTFTPTNADPELPERLRAEWPGILAWAIRGTAEWLAHGLNPPEVVSDATADYFAEQDVVGHWIEERCIVEAGARAPSSAAFRDWKGWAAARGEDAGSEKSFSEQLEKHFVKKKTNAGMMFLGVRIRPSDTGVM